jgi:putative ABC transport system permease protein
MKGLWPRVRWAWRALWRSSQLDAEMQDEMRFHVEMEAERLVREQRLDAQEARRRAHIRFGGLEKYKEQARDTRGLRWVDAVSLDARLGVRMLVKHRWLTLVGGFAMAVAIAIGAMFFEVMTEFLKPALPLEDGERVVALHYATPMIGSPERRVLHDFVALRDELVSVEQLGHSGPLNTTSWRGMRLPSRSKLPRSPPRDSPWRARRRSSADTCCRTTSATAHHPWW